VDESHSAGVVGPTGHGVAEQFNAYGRVDIFTGTLGKAFGGAMGGFTTGKKEIIDMLRQRSRPYLFSNSVAPAIIGASLEMFKILKESDALHTKLMDNVNYFRDRMLAAGFDIKPTQSAICAVMLYDAKLSQDFTDLGAEVIGISSDSVDSHDTFVKRYKLPFVLLSDTDKKLRKLFGVPSGLMGMLPGRVTYVIDKEGKVVLIFDNGINATKHISVALEAIKKNSIIK
jgi:hypothetical protein